MPKQYSFGLEDKPILRIQSDVSVDLFSLINRYKRNIILVPHHQRAKVWDETKKKNWITRIKDSHLQPIGAIVTYQLDNGKPSSTYLNDGLQRITASLEYFENPEKYGDNKEIAERVLMSASIPVQHRWYPDHDAALRDFQYINMGMSLTPYEFCHGILTNMENYNQWEFLVDDIHDELSEIMGYIKMQRKVKREKEHHYRRDNYALFCRFVKKNKNLTNYRPSISNINFNDIEKKRVVEWELRKYLESTSPEIVKKEKKLLINLIKQETVLIKHIWHDNLSINQTQTPIITLYRWLLHCRIWKRHNNIPNDIWEEFVEKVLKHTGGKSVFIEFSDNGTRLSGVTASLGTIQSLRDVCRIINSNMLNYCNRKRKQRKNSLNNYGIDESHIKPFVTHGEGDTFPEPASRNRSRGAKAV